MSYNHPELTARTLNSVLNFFQNVTLVHNGSDKKHVKTLHDLFPNVKHLVLSENRGFSGGANAGLRFIFEQFEWAFFITNDCEIKSVGELPTVPCLVSPKILIRKTEKIDSLGGLFDPVAAKLKHCRSEQEFNNSKLLKYAPGTCFLLHRDIFKATTGFDEKLGTYWEDVDFSVRALKSGFPVQLDVNWQIQHAMGKTCRHLSLYTIYYYNRNKKIISSKYTPLWKKPILYKNLAVQNVKTAGKLLMQERWEDVKTLIHAWSDD